MIRIKRFRVGLTRAQERQVRDIRHVQRYAYNFAIEKFLRDPTITHYDCMVLWTKQRPDWTKSTPRVWHNSAIIEARRAADVSNKYGNGNLEYRAKKYKDRITITNYAGKPHIQDKMIHLPLFGDVEMPDGLPNLENVASCYSFVDISPHNHEERRVYSLRFAYKEPTPKRITKGRDVGIDRGITNPTVVADSNGDVVCYDTATPFKQGREKSKKLQKKMSRQRKGSVRYKKTKEKRRLHNQKASHRRDHLEWILAREICKDTKMIVIEDLKIAAMTRKGGSRKKGLNREMRFVRHSAILWKVCIVAERMGIKIVKVDPKNTSKECRICGEMGERVGIIFSCDPCDINTNADGNASINILQRGGGVYPKSATGGGLTLERRELSLQRESQGGGTGVTGIRLPQGSPDGCGKANVRRENQVCNASRSVRNIRRRNDIN